MSLAEESLNLAWSALSASDWTTAKTCGETALAAGCGAEALHVVALSKWGAGDTSAAVELLSRAAAFDNPTPNLLSDLGVLRYQCDDWEGAADAFARALRLQPYESTARQGYADSLLKANRWDEAHQASQEWVDALPDCALAWQVLARSVTAQGRIEDAVEAAERSLQLDPNSQRTLLLLAGLRQRQRRFEASLHYLQKAARLDPCSADVIGQLALASWDVGEVDGAFAARKEALRLGPSDQDLAASLDWLALHDPSQTAASLLEVHRNSVTAWCGRQRPHTAPYRNNRDPERRLRIGYLSGEFASNAAYWFLTPWLENHDHHQVETFYYASRRTHDVLTTHYRSLSDHWRDVCQMTSDALERLIREDGIDVLVDLSGHFSQNRLSIFGRRPAPVQATFPNYPSTTGLGAIDYIFTDIWNTPVGCEGEYAEQIYRLPCGYLVYQTPPGSGSVPPLPILSNGFITFGIFQRPGKLNAAVWDAVAAVLSRVPDSRLLVHFASAELDEEGSAQRARLAAALDARGIPPGRMLFRGARVTAEHLEVVAEADIALDAFPYNGQTTTCDCLWMGVPVISVSGHSHVSRVTPALLERMGLSQLVGADHAGYVDKAVELAGDIQTLTCWRGQLRETMHCNSLTDGVRLAREIEAGYREMWRRWCRNGDVK